MAADVSEVAAMDRSGLLALWAEEISGVPPKRLSTPFLRRILAFEVQARRHGGLPSSVQRRLERIDAGEDRPKSPLLRPGGRLLREWNGISHVVDVTDTTYLWRGKSYRSLSAIARAITGAHWSGPRFFGLTGRSGQ
jgi:hypothetical protein